MGQEKGKAGISGVHSDSLPLLLLLGLSTALLLLPLLLLPRRPDYWAKVISTPGEDGVAIVIV